LENFSQRAVYGTLSVAAESFGDCELHVFGHSMGLKNIRNHDRNTFDIALSSDGVMVENTDPMQEVDLPIHGLEASANGTKPCSIVPRVIRQLGEFLNGRVY
jgi:hypothetical protein